MLSKNRIKNFDLLCWQVPLLSRLLLLHYRRLNGLLRDWGLTILIHTCRSEGCHWISAQITEIIVPFLLFLLVACVEVEIDRFARSLLLLLNRRLTHTGHCATESTILNSIVDVASEFTVIIVRAVVEG